MRRCRPLRLAEHSMEIREFAQRVLFSTSLDEKLARGEGLTDDQPGIALATPDGPGRPVDLRLRADGVKAGFPGEAKLINDEQRGVLLHFFANHELLATELMALVLLKFPTAPAAFRRGIVRTLEEEQQHTKWYLRRMKECGVTFGDLPLNRFFWDSISPMETPLDYVTRLSLTFEQANLDYARHYAGVLRAAGDEKTARLLLQIYRDEIGHVGYGLKWFRQWKAEGSSDWEAYRSQLSFPLSPARGRGNVPFNAEARRQAGLNEDFIQEMEMFSRSKGRTPNVFCFHADAEAAMAHGLEGKGFEPRAEVKRLARDLEILPAFLCYRDDVILVSRPPSAAHARKLHALGLEMPEFEVLSAAGRIAADSLQRSRKLNDLRPWVWCPQSAALLRAFDPAKVDTRWHEPVRRLFAKDKQMQALGEQSAICRSWDEVESAVLGLGQEGWAEGVAKSPFGAAGQKNRKFLVSKCEDIQAWAQRVLAQQGALVIEPWLPRELDFSMHYDCSENGLRRVGAVRLENDRRGQFQACVASSKLTRGLPEDIARFLMDGALTVYDNELPSRLESFLREAGYQGPVGIDALVFRDRDGALQLRTVVEMNPRYTMGRLTWELMRRVAPGRTVRFELIRARDPQAKTRALEQAHPPVLGRGGKLASGCVVLNEPEAVLAVLTVG